MVEGLLFGLSKFWHWVRPWASSLHPGIRSPRETGLYLGVVRPGSGAGQAGLQGPEAGQGG
jgi:hypothetical protein